jgi:hypothetical protein
MWARFAYAAVRRAAATRSTINATANIALPIRKLSPALPTAGC